MDIYFGPTARGHYESEPLTLVDIGARKFVFTIGKPGILWKLDRETLDELIELLELEPLLKKQVRGLSLGPATSTGVATLSSTLSNQP